MIVSVYIAIWILSVPYSVISRNLNCTYLTTACPTAELWEERGQHFKCQGNKRYVCLLASGNELREGCIFNFTISAGIIGCPHTMQCDILTDQPVLVTQNNYLPCPPDLDGCPSRNHSGYSILDIYKYPMCQRTIMSIERTVSLDKTTYTPISTQPSRAPLNIVAIIILVCTISGSILIAVILSLVHEIKKSCENVKYIVLKKKNITASKIIQRIESGIELLVKSEVANLIPRDVNSFTKTDVTSQLSQELTEKEKADFISRISTTAPTKLTNNQTPTSPLNRYEADQQSTSQRSSANIMIDIDPKVVLHENDRIS